MGKKREREGKLDGTNGVDISLNCRVLMFISQLQFQVLHKPYKQGLLFVIHILILQPLTVSMGVPRRNTRKHTIRNTSPSPVRRWEKRGKGRGRGSEVPQDHAPSHLK